MAEQIGAYRLLHVLGEGGMGVVYRAAHIETGQEVALKTLKHLQHSSLLALQRELQMLSRVRHPGIVQILEHGVADNIPFYVMELLEGTTFRVWLQETQKETLQTKPFQAQTTSIFTESAPTAQQEITGKKVIYRREPLSSSQMVPLLTLICQLCEALSYLHGEGLVHLDLKPGNIMLRSDGSPVLVDFGLATKFSDKSNRETLSTQTLGGTPHYMSPEQIRADPVDARADLYALGCILYEALSGSPPFVGETSQQIWAAHLMQTPVSLSSVLGWIPPALSELVENLLHKEASQRIGYADAVAAKLLTLGAQAPKKQWGKPYLYRAPLVGRQRVTEKCKELLGRSGALLVVEGAPGSGKTRLLLEWSRLASRSIDVLVFQCLERGVSVLVRALELLLSRCIAHGTTEVARIFGDWGGPLLRLLPALGELPGFPQEKEQTALPWQEARQQTLDAFTKTLQQFSPPKKKLLLLIDDVQWADELFLAWLGSLQEPPGLLVLGLRSQENNPIFPKAHRIQLEKFTSKEIRILVSEMLALQEPPDILCEFLCQQSEGNPLFVIEYLRGAIAEGLLSRDAEGRWQMQGVSDAESARAAYEVLPLPRTIASLALRRLMSLAYEARVLIRFISLLGKEVSLAVLQRCSGFEEETFRSALVELQQKNMIEFSLESNLRLVSDSLREICEESLEASDKAALHQRIASIQERLLDSGTHALLGWHWEEAKQTQKAQSYYLKAAKQAKDSYAYQQSERLFRAFFRLSSEATTQSIEAHQDLGRLLHLQGRIEDAEQEFLLAATQAEKLSLPVLQARSLRLLAGALRAWRPQETEMYLRQAISLLPEEVSSPEKISCLHDMAGFLYVRGDLASAKQMYLQTISQQVQQGLSVSLALTNLAHIYAEHGQWREAKELYQRAIQGQKDPLEQSFKAASLSGLGDIAKQQGFFEEAWSLLMESLTIVREIGNRQMEGLRLLSVASLRREMNLPEDALVFYRQALLLAYETKNRLVECLAKSELADLQSRHGTPEVGLLIESLDLAKSIKNSRAEAVISVKLAQQYLWLEYEPALIESLCKNAEKIFLQRGSKQESAELSCINGHRLLSLGESAQSELEKVQQAILAFEMTPSAPLVQKCTQLQKAQTAFLAGELLFQGYHTSSVPAAFVL